MKKSSGGKRDLRQKERRYKLREEKKRETKRKGRFLIVGALNTLVGFGMFPALYILLEKYNLHYTAILALSQVICVTFSYVSNKVIVFKTNGSYVKEYGRFISFHAIYFVINMAALPAMVELGHINPVASQIVFGLMVMATSYYWHSKITFKA